MSREAMQQAFDALNATIVKMAHTPSVQGREFVGLGIQCNKAREALRAELAKPAPVAVPEGWQLVPKMATARMLGAIDVIDRSVGMYGTDRDALMGERQANYRAMLASAPQPPAPAVDVEAIRDLVSVIRSYSSESDDLESGWAERLARAIGDET